MGPDPCELVTPDARAELPIWFGAWGRPVAQGSKRAFRAGRRLVSVDTNEKPLHAWRDTVAAAAHQVYRGPVLREPLRVEVAFLFDRPAGHFGSGRNADRLKPSAPSYPGGVGDLDKLCRALLDALTGVLWADDRFVAELVALKLYGPTAGVQVRVERMEG